MASWAFKYYSLWWTSFHSDWALWVSCHTSSTHRIWGGSLSLNLPTRCFCYLAVREHLASWHIRTCGLIHLVFTNRAYRPCNSKSLSLVPSFQRASSKLSLFHISVLPRRRLPHVYRDLVLLRPMCMARSFRPVCFPVRRREHIALDGFRICDWGR